MASRGSKAKNGHVTGDEYMLKDGKMVYDAKVLIGRTKQQHGLPDFSRSPNSKYIKENPDGTFREMRIFDASGYPIIEIGYPPEPKLTGNRHVYVLHFHVFDSDLNRELIGRLSPTENADVYEQYRKYLEEYGL
jgi:hypothetical protein